MSMNSVNFSSQAKHTVNAVKTSAALGAVGFVALKGVQQARHICDSAISVTNGTGATFTNNSKIFSFVESVGQKIFKKGSKLGNVIERYVTGKLPSGARLAKPEQIKAILTQSKTTATIGLAAGLVALGLIGRAIYKSGKINGEKNN